MIVKASSRERILFILAYACICRLMGTFTSLLGKSPRVAILEVFAANPEEHFSVPEIVRESGISKRGTYIHVRKLEDEGIIKKSRKEGKCWYYTINENDRRGEILPFLESFLTLGRIEREIKRDEGIPPGEPLVPPVAVTIPGFQVSPETEIFPFTAGNTVASRRLPWRSMLSTLPLAPGSLLTVQQADQSEVKPLVAT